MPSQTNLPIGIFDSGLGGLTVVKEVSKQLPKEKIIYVGDTARVPYGTKSPDTIKRYARQIAFFLLQKKVKAIVVACNSASSVALSSLKRFPVPILGVIGPGARAAVGVSKKKKIGVIGTQATMNSQAYRKAIKKIQKRTVVFEQACPLFVPLVEEGRLSGAIPKLVGSTYLNPLKRQGIDSLVLGCTHYPLLKGMIRSVVGPKIRLIDSAQEVTKDLEKLLRSKNLLRLRGGKQKSEFYTTDNPKTFTRLGGRFLSKGIRPAKHLSIETL